MTPAVPHPAEHLRGQAASEYVGMVDLAHRVHPAIRFSHERPGRNIQFAEFRQIVRRHRPSDLLPELAILALADGKSTQPTPMMMNAPPWGIAAAARESILSGNEYRDASVTGRALAEILNGFGNLDEITGREVDNDILPLLTRILYEQIPYQESIFSEISRSHALLIDGTEDVDLEVLTAQTLEDLLGAPFGQVVGATAFLDAAAQNNAGWFDYGFLDLADMPQVYEKWPRQVIERRAADLSSTFAEFKAEYAATPHPPPGFERYAYNPLIARPFVQMPDGRLLAPQPRLIMQTVSPLSLYHRGIRLFGDAFARDFGVLTERYTGRQLTSITAPAEVHPEVECKKGQKTIDWFLVLPSVVVMFEVKSARYGVLDRAAAPGGKGRTTETLNKAIAQLVRTSELLDSGRPALSHIPHDRPRIGVVVTAEPFYLANSSWGRELLEQAPFPTMTASLHDIEMLVTLAPEEIERQLTAIATDPERSTWNLDDALRGAPGLQQKNAILQRAFDSYPWLKRGQEADAEQ